VSRIHHSRIIDPGAITGIEKEQLVDQLFATHSAIFAGVERAEFHKYVVDSHADRTEIKVFYDEHDSIVGYFAMHWFYRTVSGEECLVLRAEAGLLREYRGSDAGATFVARQVLGAKLSHPGRKTYYLGSLVHPSSYSAFWKSMSVIWPTPGRHTPPDVLAQMCAFADEFGLQPVADDPLIRHVGWRTRDTPAEAAYWARSEKPAARFFVERNPGYGTGHGLITLVDLSSSAVARGLADWASRSLSAVFGAADRVATGEFEPSDVHSLLRRVEVLNDATDEQLAALRVDVATVPAGRWAFREGDQSTLLYVVARGRALVTIGDEFVDEVDVADAFGEIGALTGRPRTAGIRAITDLTLLTVAANELSGLVQSDDAVASAVWRTVAEHRFESLARSLPEYDRLSRAQRAALIRRGRALILSEDDAYSPAGAVLLVHGEARFVTGERSVVATAPALGGCERIVARTQVRLIDLA
jgi:CRP-like cAMP-binding protein